jgi:hypothetical protein
MSTSPSKITDILDGAESIRLEEMDSVSLQNRIDKKYILHIDQLPRVLEQIIDSYMVLEINNSRLFSYKTIYFDTPDYQFYKDHHNGLTNRIKVRCRQYVESGTTFFEIKRKYQGYRTDKYRANISDLLYDLQTDQYDEIKSRYKKHQIDHLGITLHNFFQRATLVSKKLTERVTIDFNLQFSNGGRDAVVDDIVIIEVKQSKNDERSAIVQALKKERIYSSSISKYTYGLMLVGNGVKYNAFKNLLYKVNKIQASIKTTSVHDEAPKTVLINV